jgi:signal transduction histidine kinase
VNQRRAWWLAAVVAAAAVTSVVLGAYVNNWPGPAPAPIYTVTTALVGFVYLATGLVAWRRRPTERAGLLFMTVGSLWYLSQITLIRSAVPFTFGNALGLMYQAALAHLALAWPSGRLTSKRQRALVILDYAWVAANNLFAALFWDPATNGCSRSCPANILLVDGSKRAYHDIEVVTGLVGFPLAVLIMAVIIHNWRWAQGYSRRRMAPLVWVAGPVVAFVLIGDTGAVGLEVPNVVEYGIAPLVLLLPPLAFVVTMARARLARGALGAAFVALEPGPAPERLRATLAAALGDPALQLAFRQPGGHYLDATGTTLDIDELRTNRVVTQLDAAGDALLVLDGGLGSEPQLVNVATNVASLAVQYSRLQAEVKAQLEQVRASRARIVEAGDTARRRLERDLHDGAQQRLVTLSLALGMARDRAAGTDPDLESLLESAAKEAKEALVELRELARGIHPAVLTETGLRGALQALVERSPVQTELGPVPDERYPPSVEATAYFVVSEALANVAKHAQAGRAAINLTRSERTLVVEVSDRGVGGARPEHGSGLRGLADRLATVSGSLQVDSAPGTGTRVRAEIPCP